MNKNKQWDLQSLLFTAIFCLLTVGLVSPAWADNDVDVVPQNEAVWEVGKSYGELAAAYWQWALGTPETKHPLLFETTGKNCASGQEGPIWFLGGTFGLYPGVVRECTIPPGRAVFFPIINSVYVAFLDDPLETKTKAFMKSQIDCDITAVSATINDKEVKNLKQHFFEESPIFAAEVPKHAIFGLGDVYDRILAPAMDQGVYLLLKPLPEGEHTIHFTASQSCPFGDFEEDVTYLIKVDNN